MRRNIVDYSPSVKAQSDNRTGTTTSVTPVGILYMHTFWFGLRIYLRSVKADFHSVQFSERLILCDRFL